MPAWCFDKITNQDKTYICSKQKMSVKMTTKSQKQKAKAILRQEEKQRLKTARVAVAKANSLPDPLADFPAFTNYDNKKIKVKLECKNVNDLDDETKNRIFSLERDNMKDIYNACSWGWNEDEKFAEMTEESAKYLIARNDEGEIVAFSHFRFDMDYGSEVLYCYELQLDPKVQRKGLGKLLLQVLELMAFKNNMRKVVLTVLNHNTNAVAFFHSMRYTTDETNPVSDVHNDIPYTILSKMNRRFST